MSTIELRTARKMAGGSMSEQFPESSNVAIENLLTEGIRQLEEHIDSDVLGFSGSLVYSVDDFVRDAIERIKDKKETLMFIIETNGGYLLPVERIASILRHHYKTVNFLVPNFAMSAGTVLVMSGDDIYMDYYSVLGPIDPQVDSPGGNMVSAIGYLKEFEKFVGLSNDGKLSSAELAFMLNKFDPGTLYHYDQEKQLATSLIEDWLIRYKFKNWTVTETKNETVTHERKKLTAKNIADRLNSPEMWHSHSRGISKKTLEEVVELRIKDFSADSELNKRTRSYFRLLKDYWMRRRHSLVIHTRHGYDGWGQ
ncbi:MAG: serine dehydrogenasease [candidate division Zixibacteria bacterium]|nr:serine dehydrogenasease [candidate division Zixibacteria bacterium]MBU2624797.1 serine dehydrogenasease [candidate division Zixibacteria bacterium]